MDKYSIRSLRGTVTGRSMLHVAAIAFLSLVFTFPAFSQDEDSVTGKMTDANKIAAGTAEIEHDTGWAKANCWKNLWKINQ